VCRFSYTADGTKERFQFQDMTALQVFREIKQRSQDIQLGAALKANGMEIPKYEMHRQLSKYLNGGKKTKPSKMVQRQVPIYHGVLPDVDMNS